MGEFEIDEDRCKDSEKKVENIKNKRNQGIKKDLHSKLAFFRKGIFENKPEPFAKAPSRVIEDLSNNK